MSFFARDRAMDKMTISKKARINKKATLLIVRERGFMLATRDQRAVFCDLAVCLAACCLRKLSACSSKMVAW